MKLTGTATLHAPPSQVWAALTNPDVLARSIPGCQRLEPAGPDSYRFTVTAGVASIRGTYTGEVALTQQHEPTSLVLTARGAGAPGTVATSIHITLNPADGATEVSYDADAVIGGLIGAVGQRMLVSVAGLLIGEFLTSVDQVLTGPGAALASPPPLTADGSAPADPARPGTAPATTGTATTAPATAAAPTRAAPTTAAPTTAAPTTAAPTTAAPTTAATTTAAPTTGPAFVRGALAGAAVTLAGVAIRGLIGRRSR
jgi:carbon monoxide dehydrogenase subunit G